MLPTDPPRKRVLRRAAALLRAAIVAAIALGAVAYAGFIACSGSVWIADIAASFRPQAALGMCGALVVLVLLRAWIPAVLVATCAAYLAAPWMRVMFGVHPNSSASGQHVVSTATLNLMMHNREIDTFRGWLAREGPDVLALQELPAVWRGPLRDLADTYPHGIVFPAPDDPRSETWFAIGLFTRLPVVSQRIQEFEKNRMALLEIVVEHADARWTIRAIHPVAPQTSQLWQWRNRFLARLADEFAWDDHTILLGDFNTSSGSSAFSDLVDATGLQDSRIGFGWQPTWATDQKIRGIWTDLDHLLVGGAVRVLDRRVIDVPGSDHRGVTARLELAR